MVSETFAVQLEFSDFAKELDKSAANFEKSLGKGALDIRSAVADMSKRLSSSFMEYSKADDAGKKKMRDSGMGKSEKLGVMGSKMMMGEKGFGGLAKDMKGMAAANIPMGKAFKAGGAAGTAMAAVGGLLGIVKKAFGASSILQTVAKSFWTIMGTMADVILMPMLPYMFKFLQWMMTSVMPWVLKVSEGVSAMLKGDLGPLYELMWKLYFDVSWAILTKGVPFVFKLIWMMIKGSLGVLGKLLMGDMHQGGVVGATRYHGGGTVPGGPQSEELAVLQGGETVIPRLDTTKKSVHGWFDQTGDLIEKYTGKLMRWTKEDLRKESSTGGFWQVWYDRMVGTSILPESKNATQGWFGELQDEAGSLKDKLLGWITDNPVTRLFAGIFDGIVGAFTALWGGKYSEGDEGFDNEPGGKPTYKGIWGFLQWMKDQIPSWDSITGALGAGVGKIGDFAQWVGEKLSAIWGGKYSEGDEGFDNEPGGKPTYKGIWGFLQWLKDQIPSWDSITGAIGAGVGLIGDFGGWVGEKLGNLWGGRRLSGDPGHSGGSDPVEYPGIWGKALWLLDKLPSWDSVKDSVTSAALGIGSGFLSFAGWIGEKLSGLWGGRRGSGETKWGSTNITNENEYHGIWGKALWLFDKLPSWQAVKDSVTSTALGIGSGFLSFGGWIGEKLSGLWGGRRGAGETKWGSTNITNENEYHGIWGKALWLFDKLPSWGSVRDWITSTALGIGSGFLSFAGWVGDKLSGLWGGRRGPGETAWGSTNASLTENEYHGIWGKALWLFDKLPSWDSVKDWFGSTFNSLVGVAAGFGRWVWTKLSDLWGGSHEVGTAGHSGGTSGTTGSKEYKGVWGIALRIRDALPGWDDITNAAKNIAKFAGNVAGWIGEKLSDLWGERTTEGTAPNEVHTYKGVWGIVLRIYDALPSWEDITDTIKAIGTDVGDFVGDVYSKLTDLWGGKTTVSVAGGDRHTYKGVWGLVMQIYDALPSWSDVTRQIGAIVTGVIDIGQKIYGWFFGDAADEENNGVWGLWQGSGGGIRGWIYDHTIGYMPTWSTVTTQIGYVWASMVDVGGSIGSWLSGVWGEWSAGGEGIRGWIYDHTVGLFPSMTDLKDKMRGTLVNLGVATGGWIEDINRGLSFQDEDIFGHGFIINPETFKMKSFMDILGDISSAIGDALSDLRDKLWGMVPGNETISAWVGGLADIDFKEIAVGIAQGARKLTANALDKTFISSVASVMSKITSLGGLIDNPVSRAFNDLKVWTNRYKSGGFAYFGGEGGYGPETGKTHSSWGPWDLGDDLWRTWGINKETGSYTRREEGMLGTLIPGYQKGGIVPGPRGAPQLAMVHGGETIMPAGATNNNQKVFNIQINSNLSAADIVKDIDLIDSMNTSAYSTVLG